MTSVLFVCMGNICRSPTAEGYFRHHVRNAGLQDDFKIDSAGTHSYHVGHGPDDRAVATVRARGIEIDGLRARRVAAEDFERFDIVLAMDEANYQGLQQVQAQAPPGSKAELVRMMGFSSRQQEYPEVPDPYYGGQDGFEVMCDLLDEATAALLATLQKNQS